MAQEFASDNSKTGLFSRLKLSNHRGFFSFIFVTLSVIFILITFAAVQQQQTTQSKASTVNICAQVNCTIRVGSSGDACRGREDNFGADLNSKQRQLCCYVDTYSDLCKRSSKTCNDINQSQTNKVSRCNNDFGAYCEWDTSTNKCIEKRSVNPPPACANRDGDIINRISDPNKQCCPPLVEQRVEGGPGSQIKCVSTGGSGATSTIKLTEGQRCRDGNLKYLNSDMRVADPQVSWCNTNLICDPFAYAVCRTSTNPPVRGLGQTCTATTQNSNRDYACTTGLICKTAPELGAGKYCIINTSVIGGGFNVNPAVVQDPRCIAKEGQCQTEKSNPPKALTVGGGCFYNNKLGSYQQSLCQGGVETRCCVPNSNNTGGPPIIPQELPTPTPLPNDPGNVTLDLKLSYQGIITLPKTKTQLKMKVKIVDAANKEKEKDTSIFTADSNGIWSGKVTFEDVDLSQKYYILIKGPMHVQKKICSADAADPNPGYYSCQFSNITLTSGVNIFDFSKVKMLVGDLDQNRVVNREDTGPLLSALLLDLDQRKSSTILEKFDLNLDGIVEPKDWGLMLEALKIKYDEK